MSIRIGINGFGRIGRAIARILRDKQEFELLAINDLNDTAQLAHALKYDSVYGRFPGTVASGENGLEIDGRSVRVFSETDPVAIDWSSAGVELVIEATGKFKTRSELEKHLRGSVKKVILAVPPKDRIDATVVIGVNEHLLTGSEHLVSNASCTTNAAAPITKLIHESFTITKGYINTIHAYTNGQSLVDFPHKDWRRSRAAPLSIIPTTTGAAKAVAKVIPELQGKLDGMAYRVPVPDGSIVDMIFEVARKTTAEEVNKVIQDAAAGPLRQVIEYQRDPIVSVDIIGNSHSTIFDSLLTQVLDGNLVKVASWYDNEWGYSSRIVDLARLVSN